VGTSVGTEATSTHIRDHKKFFPVTTTHITNSVLAHALLWSIILAVNWGTMLANVALLNGACIVEATYIR